MTDQEPEVSLKPTAPAPDEVRAELEHVLRSAGFQNASRACQLLRFIVEETLAGRADRLKGYTIAVEIFEKPSDFDPQSDPFVRVEAGRLRRRLMEHYLAEGQDSPARIELPRGGYTPVFRYATSPRRTEEPTAAEPSLGRRAFGRSAAVLAVLVVGVLGAFAWLLLSEPQLEKPAPPANGAASLAAEPAIEARLLVLPLTDLRDAPVGTSFGLGLSEEMIRAFVDLNVFVIAGAASAQLTPMSLDELRRQFNVGYVLTGSVRPLDDGVRISVRLLESNAGTQLWTHSWDESLANRSQTAVQEDIATQVALTIASPYGPIYPYELTRLANRPIDSLNPFECVVEFWGYVQLFDPRMHATALQCLQRTVRERPDYTSGWSALASLYLHEHTFGFDPQPDATPALERALEAARRALDINGANRTAAGVLLGIRLAAGDDAGFQRAVDRALGMTPLHPALQAQLGFLLTLTGNWQAGIPLIDQAMPLMFDPPGWMQTAYAFRDLQIGSYPEALNSALRIDAPNWWVAPMTVAAAAGFAGRTDIAAREIDRLLALYPNFETTGREQLAKWRVNEPLAETLIEGLSRAGLAVR